MDTLKILHLIPSTTWGGGERYIFDLAVAQKQHGYHVEAVARKHGVVSERFRAEGINTHIMPLSGAADVVSAVRLSRLIGDGRVIVHTHNFKGTYTAVYARMLSRNRDVRIVTTRHLARLAKTDILHSFILSHIDRLVFVSQLSEDAFMSSAPCIDRSKMEVIHNSIVRQPELAPACDLRQKYGIDASKVLVLFHGRLSAEKGIPVLLRAAARLPHGCCHILIAGMGSDSYTAGLKQLVSDLNLDGCVTLTGFLDNVWEAIRQCDFGVLPSVWKEPFGLANLEYMAAGKAHIATNNGAQCEFADDGVNAILVDPDDEVQLADAMTRLISDPDMRTAMGRKAQEKYDTVLSYSGFFNKIMNLYQSLY